MWYKILKLSKYFLCLSPHQNAKPMITSFFLDYLKRLCKTMKEEYFQKYFNYLVPKGEHKEASYLLLDIQSLHSELQDIALNLISKETFNPIIYSLSLLNWAYIHFKEMHDQNHIWIWALLLHTYRKSIIKNTKIRWLHGFLAWHISKTSKYYIQTVV